MEMSICFRFAYHHYRLSWNPSNALWSLLLLCKELKKNEKKKKKIQKTVSNFQTCHWFKIRLSHVSVVEWSNNFILVSLLHSNWRWLLQNKTFQFSDQSNWAMPWTVCVCFSLQLHKAHVLFNDNNWLECSN